MKIEIGETFWNALRNRIEHRLCLLAMIVSALIILGATALGAPPKMCLREVTGLPEPDGHGGFTLPRIPPQVDNPSGWDTDKGWTNAFRYVFNNGVNAGAAVQSIKQGNMIYLSFEVTNDASFDTFDAIVVGFDNLGAGAPANRYTFLVIHPLALHVETVGAIDPNKMSVWQTNDLTNWGSMTGTPGPFSWLTKAFVRTIGSGSPPSGSWQVQLQIDSTNSTGPNVQGTGFGLYLNAVRTNFDSTSPPDQQFSWPPGLDIVGDLSPGADHTGDAKDPTKWGTAQFSEGCSGIDFSSAFNTIKRNSDGSTVVAQTNVISADSAQNNTFTVNLSNSGVVASNVTAKFSIADFGLPASSEWQLVGLYPLAPSHPDSRDDSVPNRETPAPGIPVSAHTDIPTPTDGTGQLTAGPWTLSLANHDFYLQPGSVHQCLFVELNSTTSDTTFIRRSTWFNFDFHATASAFKSYPAVVSANYDPVSKYPGQQKFLLKVSKKALGSNEVLQVVPGQLKVTMPHGFINPVAAAKGGENGGGGDRSINYLFYVVEGCRLTGKTINIQEPSTINPNGRPQPGKSQVFENCESVGAYGYLVRHDGLVTTWNDGLSASGPGVSLQPAGDGQYILLIDQGKKAQVVTTITPAGGSQPPPLGKFAVFADLGAAIPNGTFSNVVNTGVSFNAGLEYIVNSHFSAEGIFGVHHFPGKIGGDVTAVQFTGGGKVYLTNSPNRVFARAGLGGYHFTSGTTSFGGYFGAGLLHEFNSHFGLEGLYTFHAVNTPGAATKFSTVQGGVRYAF